VARYSPIILRVAELVHYQNGTSHERNFSYPTPPRSKGTSAGQSLGNKRSASDPWRGSFTDPQAISTPPHTLRRRPRVIPGFRSDDVAHPDETSRSSEEHSAKASSSSSLETVLGGTSPPLTHIAPVLRELGIHSLDHLRAIARMENDLRNREVKREALKRGVSVVEWAILLDVMRRL
jgi:hypothetical protein